MPLRELNNARVVKIGPDQIAQAQAILCNAYQENAFTRYMFNAERPGYRQRLRGFIHEELLLHFAHNNISLALAINDRLVGVALVSRIDTPRTLLNSWRWRLGMYSVVGIRYTERLRRYYKTVQQHLSRQGHYWVSLMGLHHDFQRHGFGRALIEAVHNECERDPDYTGLCVDSLDTQYKRFFESLGYRKESHFKVAHLTMDVLFHPRGTPLQPSAADQHGEDQIPAGT